MSKSIHLFTWLAALILAALCIALPVHQWASIPQTQLMSVLAGCAAFGLSLCKLTFFPIAYANLEQGRRLPAALLSLAASIALAVSISATRDLLDNVTGDRQHQRTVDSQAYKAALNELDSISREIETLNALLAADQASAFRSRAYQQHEKLEQARQRQREATARLESAATAAGEGRSADFGKNLTIRAAGQTFTLAASTGVAAALHLACVLAVLAVTSWRPVETLPQPEKTPATHEQCQHNFMYFGDQRFRRCAWCNKVEPQQGQEKKIPARPQKPEKPAALDKEQQQLADRIVRGEFGNTMAMRNVIKSGALRGGHARVSPVFEYLKSTKQIIQHARGFELVQQTIA